MSLGSAHSTHPTTNDIERAPRFEHALFAGLDPRQLEELERCMEALEFADGEHVVRQGARAEALYLIASGTVAVVREDAGQQYVLAHIHEGEVFGELGLILDGVRTASVVAVGPVRLHALPLDALGYRPDASLSQPIPRRLARNINTVLAQRMNAISNSTVQLLRERLQMGQFFVSLICVLILYTLGLSAEHAFEQELTNHGPLVSIAALALIAALCLAQIRVMGWSLDRFGVHLRGAKRALLEAGGVTAAIMGLLTLGKWLLIQHHPDFADAPLIGLPARLEMYGTGGLLTIVVLYALFSPIQEFVVRGVLQTSLEEFLSFRRPTLAAILLSNLLFTALHLHVSYTLAGLALISGLLWGAMYARHRTLVGVSLSHAVLGLFTIYVLSSTPI